MFLINRWLSVCVVTVLIFSLASPAMSEEAQVKVMTRNLYVGADIFRIVDAVADPNPAAVPLAVAQIMAIISQTDFHARAKAIADEIKLYKPHLIGLQEVSLIRTQSPGDYMIGNPFPAENVAYDYLEILMNELAARKLKYFVAAVVNNADVELPMFVDATSPLDDARLTDRDVILVRKDTPVSNVLAQNYTYNLSIPGTSIEFTRGFAAIDAEVDGYSYRFVNTHLEGSGEIISPLWIYFRQAQAAQMYELLTILSYETKPIILVGDFNSSPDHSVITDPFLIVPPYMQALDFGYSDLWQLRNKPAGMTCCFQELVNDPNDTLYERIDHIFIYPNGLTVDEARTVIAGDDASTMTDTSPPLWPSDHAGVVGQIDFFTWE